MRWTAAAVPLAMLACSGCARYADFTLPPAPGGDTRLTFAFEPQTGPALERGQGWESHDVLNPSVVPGSPMLNLYSGFDGSTWRTGLATSADGVHWEKAGMVLEPNPRTWEGSYIAANGSALSFNGTLWYWYVAGPRERPRLGLARSSDPLRWRKEGAPVVEPGPYASWDEMGVADPYVIRRESWFYLYYLGQDRALRQRLGVARSRDGIHWEKLRTNPILELGAPGAFDENGLGEPAVWDSHGFYWMLYTGRDLGESRRLGLARSTDGVHWQKLPAVFEGGQPWDSKVVCDPTVVVDGPSIRVWFGGGDVATTTENLDGQVGAAVLRPVDGTVGK